MKRSRDEVLTDVVELLPTVGEGAARWQEDIAITEDTLLLADLSWSSIEVVILATATQDHYGQLFSFMEWWQELGRQGHVDISVRQWVDFVHANLNDGSSPAHARHASA